MQNRNLCVQRVARLSYTDKKHVVYDKGHVIACVCCAGNNDYMYTLYDESQEEQVLTFIEKLDRQRNTMSNYDVVFLDEDPLEICRWFSNQRLFRFPIYSNLFKLLGYLKKKS